MTDYEGVQQCIEKYKKSEETIKKAGLKPQAPVQEVMDTLNKVGVRITMVPKLSYIKNTSTLPSGLAFSPLSSVLPSIFSKCQCHLLQLTSHIPLFPSLLDLLHPLWLVILV